MAGWFEAFTSMAGGLGQGLDRYSQLRRLDEQNQLKLQQQKFENDMAMRQQAQSESVAGLQKQQLTNALMKQKQDMVTGLFGPGNQIPNESRPMFEEAGMGGMVEWGQFANPMEQTRPTPLALPGGVQSLIGPDGEPGRQLANDPLQGLPSYQLPDQPTRENVFSGTRDQQIEEWKLGAPMRDLQMKLGILGRMDPKNQQHQNIAEAIFPGYTRPSQTIPGGELGYVMSLPPDQRAEAIRVNKLMDTSNGGSNQDPSLAAWRQAQTAKLNFDMEQEKAIQNLKPDAKMAVNRAILRLGEDRRNFVKQTAADAARAGDDNALREIVQQAAIEGEPAATQATILGRRDALKQLQSIEEDLAALPGLGVTTGIMTGTIEDFARKMGSSTDPRLAAIGTRMTKAMTDYRRSMSGAAFSVQESKTYEGLYPNYSNQLPVNMAVIQGMKRAIEDNNDSYWQFKLGKDGSHFINIGTKEFDVVAPNGEVMHFGSKAEADRAQQKWDAAAKGQQR